jgi:virginiamycin B lyase
MIRVRSQRYDFLTLLALFYFTAAFATLHGQGAISRPQFPPKTGVKTPGVQHDINELTPIATFPVAGHPDWMAVADGGVWVTSSNANHVVWLDAATDQPGTIVTVNKPCAGLAIAFGSLWIPSCGDHNVVRVDAKTGALQATIPAGPADSEGGITASPDSIWIVTSKASDLVRIDPVKNAVAATIRIAPGSFNPLFAGDSIWVSSNQGGTLIRVSPAKNSVVGETPVGPMPRFLTAGAGSIWVLNQGDGTVARVDQVTGNRTALISAGIPGFGGEIAFGSGAVWATVFDFPITRIDPSTNTVTGQWHGAGGDSIRLGIGSIWLSSYNGAKVTRLPMPRP